MVFLSLIKLPTCWVFRPTRSVRHRTDNIHHAVTLAHQILRESSTRAYYQYVESCNYNMDQCVAPLHIREHAPKYATYSD